MAFQTSFTFSPFREVFVGFLATNIYMGVNMPVLPPSTKASAPLHRVVCTLHEPFGANRAVSRQTSIAWVSHRPRGVILRSDIVHFGSRRDCQGTRDLRARSSASRMSNPTFSRHLWTCSLRTRRASPSPSWKLQTRGLIKFDSTHYRRGHRCRLWQNKCFKTLLFIYIINTRI